MLISGWFLQCRNKSNWSEVRPCLTSIKVFSVLLFSFSCWLTLHQPLLDNVNESEKPAKIWMKDLTFSLSTNENKVYFWSPFGISVNQCVMGLRVSNSSVLCPHWLSWATNANGICPLILVNVHYEPRLRRSVQHLIWSSFLIVKTKRLNDIILGVLQILTFIDLMIVCVFCLFNQQLNNRSSKSNDLMPSS